MTVQNRQVEIFSTGCPACEQTIQWVNEIACESCEITAHDMHDAEVAKRAEALGIRSVPAVVINGQLAACCENAGPNKETLLQAGLGQGL